MSDPQYVYSSDGRRGVIIRDLDPSTDDRRFLRVRFDDGPELTVPAELLELRSDGAFDLSVGHRELMEAPNAGPRPEIDSRPVGESRSEQLIGESHAEHVVIPVVAEELRVGKRRVETGVVRVRKLVREHEETVEQPTVREEVEIERVPIGRVVDVAPETRNEGDTLVIPVLEEVLVVEKRIMLKEEVRVTWRRTEERNPQRVIVRSEEVVVDRDNAQTTGGLTRDHAPGQPDRSE